MGNCHVLDRDTLQCAQAYGGYQASRGRFVSGDYGRHAFMRENQSMQRRVAPWSLWAAGALSLLWNGMGTFLWGGTTFSPETFLADMPVAHREYVSSLPVWSTIT